MPSPSTEPDVTSLLRRASTECTNGQDAWLGPGVPQGLSSWVAHTRVPSPSSVGFLEVGEVSPTGIAAERDVPEGVRHVIGLSTAGLEGLQDVLRPHESAGVELRRLICPFAVFDFGASGPIVREVRRGLTAADLQARLGFPLFAGPDLRELAAP